MSVEVVSKEKNIRFEVGIFKKVTIWSEINKIKLNLLYFFLNSVDSEFLISINSESLNSAVFNSINKNQELVATVKLWDSNLGIIQDKI